MTTPRYFGHDERPGFLPEEIRALRESGSEFGGTAGYIAPPPHDPSASETLHMMYASDSTDPDSGPDTDDGPVVGFFVD